MLDQLQRCVWPLPKKYLSILQFLPLMSNLEHQIPCALQSLTVVPAFVSSAIDKFHLEGS